MSFENLPGFPENCKPVRVDHLTRGTKYLNDGNIAEWTFGYTSQSKYLIVEEVKSELKPIPTPKLADVLQVTVSDGFMVGDFVRYGTNVAIIEKFHQNVPTLVTDLRVLHMSQGTTYTVTARTAELKLVTFRPFANGDEFKPYRDWWIEAGKVNPTLKICWKTTQYDTHAVATLVGKHLKHISYERAFTLWKFENGHPFGCPVPAV